MRLPAALLLLTLLQELPLREVNDFCAVLRDADLAAIGATKYDLVILDHSRDHPNGATYVPTDYEELRKSAGGPKVVLASLTIGSAQGRRFYWKREWTASPPAWLGPKDPQRADSFQVKYWDPEWQAILSGHKDAYLDRLIDAGYDGVVLDAVDGYLYWQNQGVQDARESMVEWIKTLGIYARKRRAGFRILTFGSEELMADGRMLSAVDGIVRLDAYGTGGARRPEADIKRVEDLLDRAVKDGKRVFVLETFEKAEDVEFVYARCKERGYVAYCGPPGFAKVVTHPGYEPD